MNTYYDNMIKKYMDSRSGLERRDNMEISPDNHRVNLFKRLAPLTRDLLITTYGSFEKYMNAEYNPHPFEEYYISFDENMFEDDIIVSIARRMGIYIDRRINAYKVFIDRVVELIQDSNFTYDEYNEYINMTRTDYDKLNLEYDYDNRLFVFMYLYKNRLN